MKEIVSKTVYPHLVNDAEVEVIVTDETETETETECSTELKKEDIYVQ